MFPSPSSSQPQPDTRRPRIDLQATAYPLSNIISHTAQHMSDSVYQLFYFSLSPNRLSLGRPSASPATLRLSGANQATPSDSSNLLWCALSSLAGSFYQPVQLLSIQLRHIFLATASAYVSIPSLFPIRFTTTAIVTGNVTYTLSQYKIRPHTAPIIPPNM